MTSYNSMFVGNAVLAAGISEFAAGLPDEYERVERGLRLIEHRLPGGEPYTYLQAGQRELELFMKGRADLMAFAPAWYGATAIDVLIARTAVPGGRIQYRIGPDGADHLCRTLALDRGQVKVLELKAKGFNTTHNPEAIDRRTGSLRRDHAGNIVRTIQHELLMSEGDAYRDVPEPTSSYERGCYLLGAAIQRGGCGLMKSQLKRWAAADQAGAFPSEIGDVHFLEFLGHMCQTSIRPVAWFVEVQPGYQELPLEQQKVLDMPFVDAAACLATWQMMVARHGEFGVYMTFAPWSQQAWL